MTRIFTPEQHERKRAKDRAYVRKHPVKRLYSQEPRSSEPCECERPVPIEGTCFKCSRSTDIPTVTLTEEAA